MTLTTMDAFNEFYDKIKPSEALIKTAAGRQQAVATVLREAFPSTSDLRFISSHLVGSLGRGTASKPVADIDLLVRMHVETALWSNSYVRDSSKFLYRVREKLNSSSAVQKIGARGQAVRLFYSDGLWVDVAAVEKYTDGSFAIPDGTGSWLKTNPLRHAEYLEERNKALGGNLKRFVQVVKQWNKAHSSRLQSFHLEMLAARTFSSLGTDRRRALKVFFEYNHSNLSVQDPAGHSGDLSAYLSTAQKADVNRSLGLALDQATRAVNAEKQGDHAEAIRLWGLVLGNDFPSYG